MKRVIKIWAILSLLASMVMLQSCVPHPPPGPPPHGERLSPPIVEPPLYKCATAVAVEGFVPGATIDIYDYDPDTNVWTRIGGGISDAPWGQSFSVSPDLKDGHEITATQTHSGFTSGNSKKVPVEDYFQTHDKLTIPIQNIPIYDCGGALGVRNLVKGGRLEVNVVGSNQNPVGSANGCGIAQWVFINPNFETGEEVYSVETLCGQKGPGSDTETVQSVELLTLPNPVIGDSHEGGRYVSVSNITNGALVWVTNETKQMEVAKHHCSGGKQRFKLNPIPDYNDKLSATQKLCDKISKSLNQSIVQPCSELPRPTVHPICVEDPYITVSGTVPDAQIRIYLYGNTMIGNGGGNHIVPWINLSVGMPITATQELENCGESQQSDPEFVTTDAPTSYNPSLWNDPNWVGCNNCYNYACDIRTDNRAKPGYAHQFPWSNPACEKIGQAALADGLTLANEHNECDGCAHLVALFVDEAKDYHWYRLDSNGIWSHKWGQEEATNLDGSGNLITNLQTADHHYVGPKGDYTYTFCNYYCVNKNNVIISGYQSCD